MDATNDYYHDFKVEGATKFICASPTSLNPNSTPSLSVYFKSYINRYDWNNDSHSAPDVVCLDDFQPACRSDRPKTSGLSSCDLRDWRYVLGKDIYFIAMNAVNPNITQGSKVYGDILSEISRIIEEVYSEPNVDGDPCTILTNLSLDVTIDEHVLNQCVCEECRALAESALLRETNLLVPASEASIKKLKRVKVVAEAELEEMKHESGGRKRRKTNKKESKRPSDGDECSICTEHFTARKYVARMPCSHFFHKPCIAEWLRTSRKCPLCRYKMPVARR